MLYPKFEKQIAEQGIIEQSYQQNLVSRETELFSRALVRHELGNKELDTSRDKGSCTKGITTSLYKLQERYSLRLFLENLDFERIAHPKDLTDLLRLYVKTAPSSLLEDIGNIKAGDIVMLTKDDGTPGHAMMCYDVPAGEEPLLLGFSQISKATKAYQDRKGEKRRGIVLDIYAFIQDKIAENEQKNSTKKQFVTENKLDKMDR